MEGDLSYSLAKVGKCVGESFSIFEAVLLIGVEATFIKLFLCKCAITCFAVIRAMQKMALL